MCISEPLYRWCNLDRSITVLYSIMYDNTVTSPALLVRKNLLVGSRARQYNVERSAKGTLCFLQLKLQLLSIGRVGDASNAELTRVDDLMAWGGGATVVRTSHSHDQKLMTVHAVRYYNQALLSWGSIQNVIMEVLCCACIIMTPGRSAGYT